MTDAEISRRLALAIGWEGDQMIEHNAVFYVADWPRKDNRKTVLLNSGCYQPPLRPWEKFDYRDPAVIWQIAERFNCFPEIIARGSDVWVVERWDSGFIEADTAAKAVALAVIASKEKA